MTDKCGTWSYHSLDGWYLSTSPKHYHVHNCYIKSTSTERLTNTMQFQHKSITNPTISPQDKIMLALANYKTALAGMMSGGPNQQMEELQTIVTNAHTHLQQQQEIHLTTSSEGGDTPSSEGGHLHTPTTRAASHGNSHHRQINQRAPNQTTQSPEQPLPSHGKDQPDDGTTSTEHTLQGMCCRRPPTCIPPTSTHSGQPWQNKTRQRSYQKPNWCCLLRKVEKDVKQALGVMDQKSGKMMNYCQLLKHPKFSKAWLTSLANEFGRLANGVGRRIKNPTNTIRFIHDHKVPQKQQGNLTYGSFVCSVRLQKDEPNRSRFTVGGNRINYPGKVATPTADMLVLKILFNSVISMCGARFMTIDISNFYPMTHTTHTPRIHPRENQ